MNPQGSSPLDMTNREFFREVLKAVHLVMGGAFGLHDVSITPMGAEGSRLSIPVRIDGKDTEDRPMVYFGKILGGSDIMTERTLQFFKNLYLQMNSMTALFDFTRSAKEMAKHQYDGLSKIYELEIPTAKPYGYYPLVGGLWFFVAEFLEIDGVRKGEEVTLEQLDQAFQHLRRMHRKKIFHGDIKPENFIFAEQVYIIDVGHFLEDAPQKDKRAYDLACILASFLEYASPEELVKMARKYYSSKDLKRAAEYMDLVDRRPDIKISSSKKESLERLLNKAR